jgi:hypothetical protein
MRVAADAAAGLGAPILLETRDFWHTLAGWDMATYRASTVDLFLRGCGFDNQPSK